MWLTTEFLLLNMGHAKQSVMSFYFLKNIHPVIYDCMVLVVAYRLSSCSTCIPTDAGSSFPKTTDGIYIPCVGRQILSHWTTREVPSNVLWILLLSDGLISVSRETLLPYLFYLCFFNSLNNLSLYPQQFSPLHPLKLPALFKEWEEREVKLYTWP